MPILKPNTTSNMHSKIQQEHSKREGYRAAVFGKSTREKYSGWFSNDMKHGKGSQTYEDGSSYEGNWAMGMRNGHGYLSQEIVGCPGATKRRRVYTGLWLDDYPSGFGMKYFPDGGLFKGEFKNGKRHGEGNMFYPDGSIYTGMWSNDLRHGVGRDVNSKTGNYYEGMFKKDTKCGLGRYYHLTTGRIQEGVWLDGLPRVTIMVDDPRSRSQATLKTEYEIPVLTVLKDSDEVFIERSHEVMKAVNQF